jgi:branched-chain amino acid transport system ATP-binding protein
VIEIEQLIVQFGGVRPIDGLDAILEAPIAGLIGPNGAGKTTLLNVLSGFVRPAGGRVRMDGRDLLALSPLSRVKAGLRRSFQTEQVVEDLTVRQNILAIADHVCAPRGKAASVDAAMAFANLRQVADRVGRDLNLFQRRLVEIAKSIVGEPKLVLLDEPAAGLTEEEGAILRSLLLRAPGEFGAQVIIIDHDVELIRSLCSETLVLDYGRRLALGPTEAVLASPDVRRAYLGEL